MNKTLSIALAGFSFIIEEQAYIKLSDYLSALRNSLEADEVDEVMHDIEIRIVEILKDSLGKREVVYDADVEQIINQIGRPEVIEEQEEAYYSGSKKAKQNHRQLFRDPERKKISGVCSGLAQYVGMDIAVMRSIWLGIAVLGLFSAAIPTTFIVIIYTFLTITIPKAKTASDFLKMKGKPLNFDNIKDESNKIVQFANESGKKVSSFYNENKANINSTASKIGDIIRYILGGIFSLMAIGGIISIVGAFIFSSDSINISDGAELFLPFQGDIFVILGLAFFTLLLPTIIFIFLAIKMFSPKTKLKNWGYITGGILLLWIILVSVIGGMIVKEATQYQGENTTEENVSIPATSDTLYVNSYKVAIPSHFKAYGKKFWSDKKEIFHKERLYVDVTKKNIDAPYLII
ncbi:MAG: PspC domain-containing protein, partial [Bergeyella zoohelcum]|nr:PspC domain-containing protein [Bergeyella zoohelcum]